MPSPSTFDYAIIRVVPRVERGEQVNVGAIVFCKTRDFLAAAVEVDRGRLRALAPGLDLDELAATLERIPLICAGDASAGAIATLPPVERFHWLTSPKSTIVQTSAVHSGIGDDPAAALARLMQTMVRL